MKSSPTSKAFFCTKCNETVADTTCIRSHEEWSEQIEIEGGKDSWMFDIHGETRPASDGDGERLEGWVEPDEAWKLLAFVTAPAGAVKLNASVEEWFHASQERRLNDS